MIEQVFFYIFAVVAIGSAVAVVTARNAVHSAVYLIICFLQVAALFLLLRSPFLAAVQVFIYVGAVMVLFLFAVMVIDIGGERRTLRIHHQSVVAIPAVAILLLLIGYMALKSTQGMPAGAFPEAVLLKNTEIIGHRLFTQFIFPFEVVSLVLLIALIGAVALVMKEKGKGE
ncbi:MAG: NADH-quinone oxidoreductase subunit J [Deltaproteobacteria bacterium]|nr:NADH-quinone oxidoreductase subunit J [Deltaproteobacteria bacterium]